jgi:aminoglycoside phosphotransferase (APT) family kinase protein
MSRQIDLDPRAILRSLGFRGARSIERATGGADTAIWRIERGGEAYALRVFRADQSDVAGREVLAMKAAAAGDVPVPVLYAQGTWGDRPALLLSWCSGAPLSHALREHPENLDRLGVAFGEMQARLHAVPAPDGLGHPDEGWISGWLPETSRRLHRRFQAVSRQRASLLHLDYHPSNVLTDGQRITGVLDWANTCGGDPRADLARTLTILRLTPMPSAARRPGLVALRRRLERAWRQGYKQAGGAFDEMAPFYAWGGFAIAEDLTKRVGIPEHGVTALRLARMRRWATLWMQRAGLSE